MRRVGRSVWLAGLCAAALLGCGAAGFAQADETAPAAAQAGAPATPGADVTGTIARPDDPIQPELAPPNDDAPPTLAAPATPPAAQAPTPAPAQATDVADEVAADIGAAVAALAPPDARRGPLAALRDWRWARNGLASFYIGRANAPAWTDALGFNAAGRAAIARLSHAGEDGLDLAGAAIPDPDARFEGPAQRAGADLSLSEAIAAYVFEAGGGRIDPALLSPYLSARPQIDDAAKALAALAAAPDPDAALQAFNPPQEAYRQLREQLARLRAAHPFPAARAFPGGRALRVGMTDARVPLIRARFDLAQSETGENPLAYDTQVAAAVAHFQRDSGLRASGVLDAATAQALSGARPDAREAAVLANMEMWRWEPREMGEERIEINVPDFSLRLIDADRTLFHAPVIVGKPQTQTPIFSNAVRYLVVNPSWSVPRSIIRKEMLPRLAKDPDYLTRMGFDVTHRGDTIAVRQPPGPDNALGRILFMFPNDHAVYLHDTPGRWRFASARRAFSHGCIRVENPMRLAGLVMAQSGWSEARIEKLVGDKERTIPLPRPLPIHIEYFTAFVDDAGRLQIRDDIYGHTRRVEAALGLVDRS